MASTLDSGQWGSGPNSSPMVYPGTLRGYRLMGVRPQPDRPVFLELRGAWATWPGIDHEATCLPGPYGFGLNRYQGGNHAAPHGLCRCGIYHGYEPVFAADDRPSLSWVVVTASSGKIFLGPYGFRSARATIVAVAPRFWPLDRRDEPPRDWKNPATWRQQRGFMSLLGVPVYRTVRELVAACPPDDVSQLRPKHAAA
jgi:hypothetical protein